jgi:murein DD-endopeptidase MepM/ murein hydrolase activator NlpD
MRFIFFFILISMLLAPADPFQSSTGAEADQKLRVLHRERSLQPGEAVLIEAESARPLLRVSTGAFGREFPMMLTEGGLKGTGLLGIDLETQPGRYPLKVTALSADGETFALEETLIVTGKEFPTRRLNVEEKYVSPSPAVLARIRREREMVDAIFASLTPEQIWDGPFRMPVPGAVISEFGKRSIYNGQSRSPHAGVDFRGRTGTPVRAPNAGRVVLAASLYYSGKTIIIDHGMGLYSYFGHMSAFSVKNGEMVRINQVIGKIGATGLVTGPHLHWTVRLAGTRIDPLSLVKVLSGPAAV